jgi:hypothetical protein
MSQNPNDFAGGGWGDVASLDPATREGTGLKLEADPGPQDRVRPSTTDHYDNTAGSTGPSR